MPTILEGVLGADTPSQIAKANGGGMNLWKGLMGEVGLDDDNTTASPARDEILLAMDYLRGDNDKSCLSRNVSSALRWQHWKIITNEKWCDRAAPSASECDCDTSDGTYLFNLAHDP